MIKASTEENIKIVNIYVPNIGTSQYIMQMLTALKREASINTVRTISSSNAWKWKVKVKSLSRVRLLATPWTAAYQAPLSMGFSKQEYWSRVSLPSLDDVARSQFSLSSPFFHLPASSNSIYSFNAWALRRTKLWIRQDPYLQEVKI